MTDITNLNYMVFRNIPLYGMLAVLGGFLLQFTMGSFYSFGNMMTYMTSYMRAHGSPNITYEDFVVVQSTWGMTQGTVMPMAGFIIHLIGERAAMTTGAFLFSLGCALTYFTLSKDLWMVAATYGFVSAFGQNIALIPTLTTAMKWFPGRKGTAMGIVVGGFGGGAMVFNQIQTAIVNPNNVGVAKIGSDQGYFVDPDVLDRVPNLLLILSGIYATMGLLSVYLIRQPTDDWVVKQIKLREQKNTEKTRPVSNTMSTNGFTPISTEESPKKVKKEVIEFQNGTIEFNGVKHNGDAKDKDEDNEPLSITWKEALMCKEFYLLWFTRLSVVLITQVVAALYKAFGQTFICDDHFLSMVGAVSSFFNCSGRLLYGWIMDKTAYKIGMSLEAVMLTVLVATLPLTSYIGTDSSILDCNDFNITNFTLSDSVSASPIELLNSTIIDNCVPNSGETQLITKVCYAIWVWAIFLTFPGTYSMQPAVTTHTFGHKYGGTIYAFLFSADIINNLLVATMSKKIKENYGYLGLFLIISVWGILALTATLFYPLRPSPERIKRRKMKNEVPNEMRSA